MGEGRPPAKLSVIVPVYNEATTVGEVIDRVAEVPLALEREIIVVDDGSTDRSLELVRSRGPKVRFVHEGRVNQGKGTAVRIGLTYATGEELAILQDADLELDPLEYARLLAPILRGEADAVFGSRFLRQAAGIRAKTRLQNRALALLTNALFGSRLTDVTTAYRVLRVDVMRGIRLESRRFEIESEITAKLLRLGMRIVEVPIGYRPRTAAEGKKIRWRDGVAAALALVRWRLAPVASFAAAPSPVTKDAPAR
jgi:glycosyltransferase involved in cell wall biosynthesis